MINESVFFIVGIGAFIGAVAGAVTSWFVLRQHEKVVKDVSQVNKPPAKKGRSLTENEKYLLKMAREARNGIKS